MSLEKFMSDTRKIAKANGIKIRLLKQDMVIPYGQPHETKGYFDDSNKELVVCIDDDYHSWVHILVHESCHMDQYLHDKFLWDKCSPAVVLFDKWLSNKSIVKREVLEEAVDDIIRLELDCERRSLDKIKKYDLDIDHTSYQKIANICIYLYLFSLEKKKWLPDLTDKKTIYDATPSSLKKDYTKIPRQLHRAFNKEYNLLYRIAS